MKIRKKEPVVGAVSRPAAKQPSDLDKRLGRTERQRRSTFSRLSPAAGGKRRTDV